MNIFFTENVSNQIIKYDRYFLFFIYPVPINILINIIHIITYPINLLQLMRCLKPTILNYL